MSHPIPLLAFRRIPMFLEVVDSRPPRPGRNTARYQCCREDPACSWLTPGDVVTIGRRTGRWQLWVQQCVPGRPMTGVFLSTTHVLEAIRSGVLDPIDVEE